MINKKELSENELAQVVGGTGGVAARPVDADGWTQWLQIPGVSY